MLVVNKTHRFSELTKTFNYVLDANSFSFQSGKRLAYSQRLYFEYLYTQKVNGTTFFYTLTYNDKSIPHYFEDTPCFNYADIRLVTNGVLSKELERSYGSRLRYFIACETGEGKGSRGSGKNPHYHCIFFVQPIHKDGIPQIDSYKPIHPIEFRRIIRRVWQGSENDYVNFNEARFGIAKEGDNCGLVSSVAPFKYCAKYVLKDNNELALEDRLLKYWKQKCLDEGLSMRLLWYFYQYNKFLADGYQFHELYYELGLDKYQKFRKTTTYSLKSYDAYIHRFADVDLKVRVCNYLVHFQQDKYCELYPKFKLNEYRNLYSGKVRCSKGLGEYGLNFIKNPDSQPMFSIPSPQGFEVQSISQYYYRKLYYDKYICDVTGSVLYRLNDRGKRLKINTLSNTIEKHSLSVKESLSIVFNNHFAHFDKERSSNLINSLVENPLRDDIIYRYSLYKVVYENRFYHPNDMISLDPCFSLESAKVDYERFIENDSVLFDYQYDTPVYRLSVHSSNYISFSSHPNFQKYKSLFTALDDLLESVRRFRSENAKSIFKANADLQSKLKAKNYG